MPIKTCSGTSRTVPPIKVLVVVLIPRPALGRIADGCGRLFDGTEQVEVLVGDIKGHGEQEILATVVLLGNNGLFHGINILL